MKHLCIAIIRFYQRCISPLKSKPTCRFTPTCSAYAIEAFTKRGFLVGLVLTVWRILRCQPLSAGGYDPVPERGLSRKKEREARDNEPSEQPKLICEDYVLRRERRRNTTVDTQASRDRTDK